ncbi:rhomboid-like protein 14, mitochondrial [Ananas comosus]|uniref:Rhomboid-like protein 14, mitochondrial n=1 Tax=Ananas comosus TaxID=4615 RepID=A0A199V9V6_ANACO|nr:rhomboid-like protein 14, mitochondrial [Ananas comosus]OAY73575.1 Rhomboid-like protein 14, mitochondrial [Ananas comosus]
MERGRSGGVWRGMLPLLGLHVANEYYRLGRKPPVTAGLILANTLIYLRPGPLHRILPTVDQVCFNPHLILKYGDMRRFFLSAFYHMGESHLVYNMMSLLWKGIQLETSMGSVEFASMVAALLGLSQGITLLLSKGLLLLFDYETAYYHQFAVGFSGVLFAMKVVLNARSDDEYSYVHGMIIPTRHAAWAELILIQLFVPGVSFLGHLGGILAGLAYLQLRGSFLGSDPLALLIRNFVGAVSWPLRFVRSLFSFQRPRISGRGRVGRNLPGRVVAAAVWRCPVCTYDNSAWVDVCEMCSTVRQDHHHDFSRTHPSDRSGDLSLEELRRRRLERFER